MKTRILFYNDPYLTEFDATIELIEENSIKLSQTCFFPESGGQPFDTGFIADKIVTAVKKDRETGEIVHVVDNVTLLQIGQVVKCSIDWEKRHKHMRLHSALHVLYLVFIEKYGKIPLKGSNIEFDKARLDFEYFEIIDVKHLSKRTNEIIAKFVDIETGDDLKNNQYRYWKIDEFDVIPCGGTHVRNTSEIGAISCRLKNKGKQGQRIYIELQS